MIFKLKGRQKTTHYESKTFLYLVIRPDVGNMYKAERHIYL